MKRILHKQVITFLLSTLLWFILPVTVWAGENTTYLGKLHSAPNKSTAIPIYTSSQSDCPAITESMLPYTESFDSGALPSCWSYSMATKPNISTIHVSAPASLSFFSAGGVIAATEEFDMNVSTLQVNFQACFSDVAYGFIIGVMTDPAIASSFTPVDTVKGAVSMKWEEYTISLSKYTGQGKYIAFKQGGFNAFASYYVYMDNLVISKRDACVAPNNIKVANITDKVATISWTENGNATAWDIIYGAVGFNPADGGVLTPVSTNPAIITGLTPNTMYDIYVRADCGSNGVSQWSLTTQTFRTEATPEEIPYQYDFEDSEKNAAWVFFNGNQTNQWHIGSAVNNTQDGSKSLYISNSGGATHSYSGFYTSYVYATRVINFEENGKYELSFDWRANGQNNYDVMRVFLVPNSVALTAGNANGMTGASNPTPSGWIDIGGGNLNANNAWQTKITTFEITNSGNYKLVFFWKNDDWDDYQSPAAVDNISIIKQYCAPPSNFTLHSVKNTEALITWEEMGSAINWEVQYGPKGFLLGTGNTMTVSDTFYNITGLLPNFTQYEAYVQAVCGSYWIGPVSFSTTQPPVNLPYLCQFEDDTENESWTLANGTLVNQWHIDIAQNNTPYGAKAMYISNSNGATHTYTVGSISYVYAMRTLNIDTAGIYEIQFDWMANGSASFDLARAFLVPATIEVEAGFQEKMGGGLNGTPEGWIDIANGNLCQQSSWQHLFSEVEIPAAGIYNLTFLWKNYSFSGGNQPPAAIDNIDIRFQTCRAPNNFSLVNVTNSEAIITWNARGTATRWEVQYGPKDFPLGSGDFHIVQDKTTDTIKGLFPNEIYDMYIRSTCDGADASVWSSKLSFKTTCGTGYTLSLPHFENFDSYENGEPIPTSQKDVIPDCWIVAKSANVNDLPYIANWGVNNYHSESYSLDFGYTQNGYNLAILPAMDTSISMNTIQLSFWARSKSGGYGTFSVGIMDSTYIDAPFTVIASYYRPGTTFRQYNITFEDYTGTGRYIAFKWENGLENSLSLDDVELSYSSSAACIPPVSPTASNIVDSSATVTWSAGANETAWKLEYKPISETNYSAPITINAPNYTLTNLTPYTDYVVRVRAACDDSSVSAPIYINFQTSRIIYKIIPTTDTNGSIIPADTVRIVQGDAQTFTFIPNDGYEVDEVKVNDNIVAVDTFYTFTNVQENATIHVTFKEIIIIPDTFVVIATADTNGMIDPAGEIKVVAGSSITFTFTPEENYEVRSILVNGDSVGNSTTHTIEDIQENMTIHVEFQSKIAIKQYQLDNNIVIYPNPVTDQLNVKLSAVFDQLEITNLLGQVLYTANINDSEFTISVSNYNAGLYFIRLTSEQGTVTKKFFKE